MSLLCVSQRKLPEFPLRAKRWGSHVCWCLKSQADDQHGVIQRYGDYIDYHNFQQTRWSALNLTVDTSVKYFVLCRY
jgi:hypothetical protein